MTSSRRLPVAYNTSTYDSAGGKDYSVLATWEAATDNNLVTATAGEVLDCYKGAHNDADVLDGATTNASYFRVIRPADGEGHSGIPKSDGSCVCFIGSSSRLGTYENYSSIHDIVVSISLNTSSNRLAFYTSADADYGSFIGCIAFDCANAGTGAAIGFYTADQDPFYIINCAAFNNKTTGFLIYGVAYIYNSIAYGNSIGFASSGTQVRKNCILDGNTTDSTGTWTTTTCLIGSSPTYVDSANDDFHLALGDTTAKDQGTDLSGDGVFAFDDDIDGETRSGTWDIGFDEYVVTAGGTLSINVHDCGPDGPAIFV